MSEYDVVVIGAGIVGSAIARELSGYDVTVALLEARGDVGDGTSKANTAILHTGFDANPGTLESALGRACCDRVIPHRRGTDCCRGPTNSSGCRPSWPDSRGR